MELESSFRVHKPAISQHWAPKTYYVFTHPVDKVKKNASYGDILA
jgi:hypothetical protein